MRVEFFIFHEYFDISDDGPIDFGTAAAKAHRITSHTADDLDTIQSKSKRQDQALLSDISNRLVGQPWGGGVREVGLGLGIGWGDGDGVGRDQEQETSQALLSNVSEILVGGGVRGGWGETKSERQVKHCSATYPKDW